MSRFAAALGEAGAGMVQTALDEGRIVPGEDLARAARDLATVTTWRGPGRAETDRGIVLAQLALAGRTGNRPSVEYLAEARQSLERGLAHSPADPLGWAWLARVRLILSGPSREAVAAVRNSMEGAIYDPKLLVWRLSLAARARDYWDPEFTDLFQGQVALAWLTQPRELTAAAARQGFTDIVALALRANGLPADDRAKAPFMPMPIP
ncbi:MAG TPA: hypothetical protein VGC92_14960 [Phenylobacterium sp.]